MSHLNGFRVVPAAVFGLVLAFMATSAPAQEADDTATQECIASCREAAHACFFDAREAGKLCLEEAGCDTLRDDYRATCLVADRDAEACAAARTALQQCTEPCREMSRGVADACREASRACITEDCGVEDRRPAHPGRGSRPGRGERPHHGFNH